MRDVPDYMLEPPDPMADVLADEAREQAEADAWEALLSGDDDMVIVDILEEYSAEEQGECFELVKAYRADNKDDMLEAARKVAVKLEGVMEGYVNA